MRKILVVDDEPSMRELLEDFLEARGYNVVASVENGQKAMDFFLDGKKADLIITDLKMPVLDGVTDGLTLIRWVKNNLPNVLVILVTGNADDEYVFREAHNAGVYEIISKPFFPGALLAVIKTALRPEIWEGV